MQLANKKFSSNGFYAGAPQYDPNIVDETKYLPDETDFRQVN